MTRIVDLGRDALALRGLTHELVPRHPREPHVPARELQVGIADAGHTDAYDHLAGRGHRLRVVWKQPYTGSVTIESAHGLSRPLETTFETKSTNLGNSRQIGIARESPAL
jgi:hypothetical protein